MVIAPSVEVYAWLKLQNCDELGAGLINWTYLPSGAVDDVELKNKFNSNK